MCFNVICKNVFSYLFVIIVLQFSANADEYNPHPVTKESCEKTKALMTTEKIVNFDFIEAPIDYSNPKLGAMKLFYWVKKGIDSTKPPILLVHGGVGGHSWRYYSWIKTFDYAGDIVSIDHRNEGCSNITSYDNDPESYHKFGTEHVVEDLEKLRLKLYPNKKWRLFGQSRGAFIIYEYLAAHPYSIESVATHGFAMLRKSPEDSFYFRSRFNAEGSRKFELAFPNAAFILRNLRSYFVNENICLPMRLNQSNLAVDQLPVVCRENITDAISFKLTNYSKWKDLAESITALANPEGIIDYSKARNLFQSELNSNIYVQYMNYILGTNAVDMASPAPQVFGKILFDLEIMDALISEGRFVARVVYPAYLRTGAKPIVGDYNDVNLKRIKKFLRSYFNQNGEPFSLVLFSSIHDTIAPPPLATDLVDYLGPLINLVVLEKSGHEGWQTEKRILEHLKR